MKKWIARFGLIFLGVIIGSFIGVALSSYYFADSFKTLNQMFALGYSAWESDEALYQYKNGDIELAKYSLEHYALISEGFKEYNKRTNSTFIPALADLGFVYVRLGNIAKKEGNEKLSENYYEKALENYRNYCLQNNIKKEYATENLKVLVDRLDEKSGEVIRKPFISILLTEKE